MFLCAEQILKLSSGLAYTGFPVPGTGWQPHETPTEGTNEPSSSDKPCSSEKAENLVPSRGRQHNARCQLGKVVSGAGFWLSNRIEIQNSELLQQKIPNLGPPGKLWADEFCFVLRLGLHGALQSDVFKNI